MSYTSQIEDIKLIHFLVRRPATTTKINLVEYITDFIHTTLKAIIT